MQTAIEELDRLIEQKTNDIRTLRACPEYRQELLLHLDADDEAIQNAIAAAVQERLHGAMVGVGKRILELSKRGYEVSFGFVPSSFGLTLRIRRLGLCWQEYISFDEFERIDLAIRKAFDRLIPEIDLYGTKRWEVAKDVYLATENYSAESDGL